MKETPNRIVLIDDDRINNMLNERLLKKLGIFETIHIFLDGESALHSIQNDFATGNDCPELIFMDINMPVMNGFEFLENFKKLDFKNKERVNVIGVTTSMRDSDMERLKQLNCRYILNKPLTKNAILELFEKLYDYSNTEA